MRYNQPKWKNFVIYAGHSVETPAGWGLISMAKLAPIKTVLGPPQYSLKVKAKDNLQVTAKRIWHTLKKPQKFKHSTR